MESGPGQRQETAAALLRAHRALDLVCTSVLYADDVELRAAQPLVDMLRRDITTRLRARGALPTEPPPGDLVTIAGGRRALDDVWQAVVDDEATRDLATLVTILQHTFDRVLARPR